LLLLAAIIAFGGCLWGTFHFDDYSLFAQDLWRPFEVRPLTYLTFWINDALGGQNPVGYHAVNLLLHLAATLLLWIALQPVLPARALLIATAIFAVHPFQAEPVNYIFARSTVLATLFCLAALACWTRGRLWWAVALFAAGLLSKEECVAFPVFLLLMHWSGSRDRKERAPIAAMFLLSIATGLWVLKATSSTPGSGAGAGSAVSWQTYALTQGVVILRYFRMLLIPWGFTVDPDIPVPPVWMGLLAWIAVLALAGIAALRFPRMRAGFWFIAGLILLLPSSSVLPATDLAADRRMYLPMIAFAVCAGLLLERVPAVYLATALLALTGLSFVRTSTWRTEESLWSDAMAAAPEKIRPRIQLARSVEPARALQILEQARALAPDDPAIPSEEGRIYMSLGKPLLALPQFGRALALSPRSAEVLNNRGVALLALDQKDAARQDFERALALDACQFDARMNMKRLGVAVPPAAACKYSSRQMDELTGSK
jgi:hypothetical protein